MKPKTIADWKVKILEEIKAKGFAQYINTHGEKRKLAAFKELIAEGRVIQDNFVRGVHIEQIAKAFGRVGGSKRISYLIINYVPSNKVNFTGHK